jgi:hypothetical protein
MSAQTPTTETRPTRTARPQFTPRDAPQTFDPHNTNPCPEMFADKWTSEE